MGQLPSYPRSTHHSGFTLVELLVVAAVFSLTMLIGTTVFISVQSRQTEVLRRQRLVADGRFVLETLARSVRLEAFDYDYYYTDGVSFGDSLFGPASNPPPSILVTRNELNIQTCFRLNTTDETIEVIEDCQSNPPDDQWRRITPPDIRVTAFTVLTGPDSNPYAPPPKSVNDCKANPDRVLYSLGTQPRGYDQAAGVCRCRSNDIPPADDANDFDCFPHQLCVYPAANQSTNNFGQGGPCILAGDVGANCSAGNVCTNGPRVNLSCTTDEDCRQCFCRNAVEQPQVTLFISTESVGGGLSAPSRVALQTTVVSRAYGR